MSTNNSLLKLSQIIQNFDKINIKEIEPTEGIINKNIFEGDLSIIIDELVELIFMKLNEGKDAIEIKKYALNYINDNKIISQEISNYLLNNQTNSNSIYLFGYFTYYGIGIDINTVKGYTLFQKAAKLQNEVAQNYITLLWEDSFGLFD